MKANRESGSAQAVVISCLVVVILFALGWIFWQNFIYKNPSTNQKEAIVKHESSKQNSDNQSPDTGQASDPSVGGKYLVISEWGVRLPLTSETDGAVYEVEGDSAMLSTASLTKKSADCGVDGSAPGGGMIMRGKAGETTFPGGGMKFGTADQVKIGDYYYVHMGSQATCTSDGAAEIKVLHGFQSQLKFLEAY